MSATHTRAATERFSLVLAVIKALFSLRRGAAVFLPYKYTIIPGSGGECKDERNEIVNTELIPQPLSVVLLFMKM